MYVLKILVIILIFILYNTHSGNYILGGSRKISIYGTIFSVPGKLGDFEWMINQPEYRNSLFIFNDNIVHHNSSRKGAGNAVIRPYNKYGFTKLGLSKPLSAGIPTGTSVQSNGFQDLNEPIVLPNGLQTTVKIVIDNSINEIKKLLHKYKYDAIYYSASNSTDATIGASIFAPSVNVKEYITKKIHSLGKFNKIIS